jgi:hypothetical protein
MHHKDDSSGYRGGGYARIYLKIIILKNYMHHARAALARALAPRAKVGGISQRWTIQAIN